VALGSYAGRLPANTVGDIGGAETKDVGPGANNEADADASEGALSEFRAAPSSGTDAVGDAKPSFRAKS
jgi:hypothetical protein